MISNLIAIEIEKTVIASMLYTESVYKKYIGEITEDLFYHEYHRTIFKKMVELDSGDIVVISEATGMHVYLSEISESVTYINIAPYITILVNLDIKRKLFNIITNYTQKLDNKETIGTSLIEELNHETGKIISSAYSNSENKPEHIGNLIEPFINEVANVCTDTSKMIKFGIKPLDDVLGCIMPGEYVTLGATPSSGKTSLALQMALNLARKGKKVLIFSLETKKSLLTGRTIFINSAQCFSDLTNNLRAVDKSKMQESINDVVNLNLWIDDKPSAKVSYITSKIEALKNQVKFDLIIIDHIHLMTPEGKVFSRHDALTQISAGIKELTRKYCPVLALAQLNKSDVKDESYVPSMFDLRESGSLGQDADKILLIHTPYAINKDNPPWATQIVIAKNKLGNTGKVPLRFQPEITTFTEPDQEVFEFWNGYGKKKKGFF